MEIMSAISPGTGLNMFQLPLNLFKREENKNKKFVQFCVFEPECVHVDCRQGPNHEADTQHNGQIHLFLRPDIQVPVAKPTAKFILNVKT